MLASFDALRTELDYEKRTFEKVWKRREEAIARALDATSRLDADLHLAIDAPQNPMELLSGGLFEA
jgi:hypothetical protein